MACAYAGIAAIGADMSSDATVTWVRLRTAGTAVRGDYVLQDPVLAALAVEDLCWEIARSDWAAREPRRWQPRRRARWHAEDEELWARRAQLRRTARLCGLAVM